MDSHKGAVATSATGRGLFSRPPDQVVFRSVLRPRKKPLWWGSFYRGHPVMLGRMGVATWSTSLSLTILKRRNISFQRHPYARPNSRRRQNGTLVQNSQTTSSARRTAPALATNAFLGAPASERHLLDTCSVTSGDLRPPSYRVASSEIPLVKYPRVPFVLELPFLVPFSSLTPLRIPTSPSLFGNTNGRPSRKTLPREGQMGRATYLRPRVLRDLLP